MDIQIGINIRRLRMERGMTQEQLPAWQAPIDKEALFERDSKGYRYWNARNAYGLWQVVAMKLAWTVRYDPELAVTDSVLADCLQSTYGTLDPAAWEADRLLHSPHRGMAACAGMRHT